MSFPWRQIAFRVGLASFVWGGFVGPNEGMRNIGRRIVAKKAKA